MNRLGGCVALLSLLVGLAVAGCTDREDEFEFGSRSWLRAERARAQDQADQEDRRLARIKERAAKLHKQAVELVKDEWIAERAVEVKKETPNLSEQRARNIAKWEAKRPEVKREIAQRAKKRVTAIREKQRADMAERRAAEVSRPAEVSRARHEQNEAMPPHLEAMVKRSQRGEKLTGDEVRQLIEWNWADPAD